MSEIKEIVFEIGKIYQNMGMPSYAGQIWSLLYLKGDMSQDEIRKQLNCGLSSVSQSLTLLEHMGSIEIINKIKRKNIYRAESSMIKTRKKMMENMLTLLIEPMVSLLDKESKEITDKKLKIKILELKDHYKKDQKFMKFSLSVLSKPKKLNKEQEKQMIKMIKNMYEIPK